MPLSRPLAAALGFAVLWSSVARAEDPPVEVVVPGATRSPIEARDRTAATYVVHRAYLRAPGATAADALAAVPGVEITRGGAASELSTAAVRGATAAQTPVYLAGIRLNDDLTGTADLSTVPLWMLDRIEVYRGNAPSDADRLGLGGAIFMEPLRPKASRVGAGGEAGSFGQNAEWISGSLFAGGDASALVTVRREAAANDYPYLDDGGTRFVPSDDVTRRRSNADSESYSGWGIAQIAPSPGSQVVLLSNVFVREQGVTGLSSDAARQARLRSQRAIGGISSKVPCAREGCELELVSSALASEQVLRDPERKFGLGSALADSRGQRIAERERLKLEIGRSLSLTIASQQEAERLDIDTAEGPLLRARREVGSLGSTLLFRATDGVELVALGSIQCDGTSGPGRRRGCDASATGRLGLRVEPSRDLTLSFNLGRYERVPTLGERFGLSPALRGNAALEAEVGWNVDAGGRWSHRRSDASPSNAYVEAFAFSRFASDLIAFQRSSFNAATPFNVGRGRVLGFELAAGGDAFGALHAEVSLTALDARDTSDGRSVANDLLPFRSRLVASPLVELYAEPSARPLGLDRLSWGTRAVYRSSHFADPAGLSVMPEQLLVDSFLESAFARRSLVVRLRVANVLDAPAFDIIGYPLPGRSFHASVEAWWP